MAFIRRCFPLARAGCGTQIECTHYPGGLALRFARLKRYRMDKGPQDADTIERVRALGIGAPLTKS
jgi:hypothetical protein